MFTSCHLSSTELFIKSYSIKVDGETEQPDNRTAFCVADLHLDLIWSHVSGHARCWRSHVHSHPYLASRERHVGTDVKPLLLSAELIHTVKTREKHLVLDPFHRCFAAFLGYNSENSLYIYKYLATMLCCFGLKADLSAMEIVTF